MANINGPEGNRFSSFITDIPDKMSEKATQLMDKVGKAAHKALDRLKEEPEGGQRKIEVSLKSIVGTISQKLNDIKSKVLQKNAEYVSSNSSDNPTGPLSELESSEVSEIEDNDSNDDKTMNSMTGIENDTTAAITNTDPGKVFELVGNLKKATNTRSETTASKVPESAAQKVDESRAEVRMKQDFLAEDRKQPQNDKIVDVPPPKKKSQKDVVESQEEIFIASWEEEDELDESASAQIESSSGEALHEASIEFKEDIALDLIAAKRQLTVDQKDAIKEQLNKAFLQLETNREVYLKVAEDQNQPFYIRGEKIEGENDKAKYQTSHIQVNPDGSIYVIPKNPALWLGEGGFKKVRLALELNEDLTPKKVVAFASIAVKDDANTGNEREDYQRVVDESNIAKELLNEAEKGDVKVWGFTPDKAKGKKAKLVLPYSNIGDLSPENIKHMEKNEINQLLIGCVDWIKKMHDNGIANRDIKPENFLAFRENNSAPLEVKCLDLGIATKDTVSKELAGTPYFIAPEALFKPKLGQNYNTKAADIYSLGVTLINVEREDSGNLKENLIDYFEEYEEQMLDMWADEDPFAKDNYDRYKEQIKEALESFKPKTQVQWVAKLMMNPEPNLRPNIDQVATYLKNQDPVDLEAFGKSLIHKQISDHYHVEPDDGEMKTGDMLIRKSSTSTLPEPVFTLAVRTSETTMNYRFTVTNENKIQHDVNTYDSLEAFAEAKGGKKFV